MTPNTPRREFLTSASLAVVAAALPETAVLGSSLATTSVLAQPKTLGEILFEAFGGRTAAIRTWTPRRNGPTFDGRIIGNCKPDGCVIPFDVDGKPHDVFVADAMCAGCITLADFERRIHPHLNAKLHELRAFGGEDCTVSTMVWNGSRDVKTAI